MLQYASILIFLLVGELVVIIVLYASPAVSCFINVMSLCMSSDNCYDVSVTVVLIIVTSR